jgi:hypothetical protein
MMNVYRFNEKSGAMFFAARSLEEATAEFKALCGNSTVVGRQLSEAELDFEKVTDEEPVTMRQHLAEMREAEYLDEEAFLLCEAAMPEKV